MIISGPIFLIHSNGIIYSESYPNRPQILHGPGTMIASIHPLHIFNSTSTTHPSRLQLHRLITSFSLNSQKRILCTCSDFLTTTVCSECVFGTPYGAITFSRSNAFTITPVSTAPNARLLSKVEANCIQVTSSLKMPFSTIALLYSGIK